jgi:benzoate/toluate 1,2-dioxygenase beta subunit
MTGKSTVDVARWFAVQAFLQHEARLLDERRFDDWLALYAEDAEYWVPSTPDQTDPTGHVSLFYESVALLKMRVDRLARGLAPLEWPPGRANRHLGNVTIEADDGRTVTARALMLFVEYRRDEQRWYSCRCTWTLRAAAGDTFVIAAKRVDLLDCDREGGHLRFAVPF